MKIFLIGMPASGKTFLAEKLKKKLKLAAYDLDGLVEMMEEQTINEIFAEGGEESFRKLEAKMLRLFKEKKKFILSCGGGAPCFHDNMEWMNKQGITIWIDEPQEVLVERLLAEKDHRPLVKDMDAQQVKAYVAQTLEDRTEFYAKAQHRVTAEELLQPAFFKSMMEYA
jgi:shikimate kinase